MQNRMHPLTRKDNSTVITTKPSFSFFSHELHSLSEKMSDFVICHKEIISRFPTSDKVLGSNHLNYKAFFSQNGGYTC